jgi:hypothetical protein
MRRQTTSLGRRSCVSKPAALASWVGHAGAIALGDAAIGDLRADRRGGHPTLTE